MIKAVIFDFGGTVHSLNGKKASEILAPILNRDREEIRKIIVPGLIAMSVSEMSEQEFFEKLGKSVPELWKIQMNSEIYKPIIELVGELKKMGIVTAVLSNTILPHSRIIRARGWYDFFDKVYLSYEIKLRKPNKEIYEYVLKDIGVTGEECIFVDDLEENLVPARELGMKVILAKDPSQTVKEVKNYLN
jgi:epoxide hydrolase-like predicted phosphatase